MIRTFVLAVVLTLAAGVALGFFAAQAAGRRPGADVATVANPIDGAIEDRVRGYTERYRLTPAQEQSVRGAFREYDKKLAALFRRLQLEHKVEFEEVTKRANEQLRLALEGAERR